MNYDRLILNILLAAGATGMSVKDIARYVYNASNSFFMPLKYEDVHRYVASYLMRNSKKTDSLIEKTEERGVYRLNVASALTQQLELDFTDNEPEAEMTKPDADASLSLF